ncbi:uncharacterized protein LOC119299994 [Triticum dicoccoides]|uniref:uncharacterized protein LOC119299994 n=1 Tax=Triticum dicoccoides TaxID=85692 RepID=UPI00189043AB|nr:uncharacterized protein LOC119299994 [Triticum dicoccoides]
MPPLLTFSSPAQSLAVPAPSRARLRVAASAVVGATGQATNDFPSFLPSAVESIRDGAAIRLAKRIQRVPVQTGFSTSPILSSCVRPLNQQQSSDPVLLLYGFDSWGHLLWGHYLPVEALKWFHVVRPSVGMYHALDAPPPRWVYFV